MRQDPTLAPWIALRERLTGYFAARARGILALEYVLSSRSGEEFGRLRVHGPEGAELEIGVRGRRSSAPTARATRC